MSASSDERFIHGFYPQIDRSSAEHPAGAVTPRVAERRSESLPGSGTAAFGLADHEARALGAQLIQVSMVWLVAAIGMATTDGLYVPPLEATLFGLGSLAAMKPLERRLVAVRRPQLLAIVYDRRRTSLNAVKARLTAFGVQIERADIRVNDEPSTTRIEFSIKRISSERLCRVVENSGAS